LNELLYILKSDGTQAPYPESQVRQWWNQGQLPRETLYWKQGMAEWRPLTELFGTVPTLPFVPASLYVPLTYPMQSSSSPPMSAPSGYPNQAVHQPVMFFAKNPVGLTTALKVMLGISTGLAVIALGSNWMQSQLLGTSLFSMDEANANDARQGIIAIFQILCYVITAIVFGMWIYRANRNVRGFGAQGLEFTPGWAVGWYFIPFLNLIRPYQAMREIWQASSNPHRWASESGSPLLNVWWVLWLTSNILGQVVFRMSMQAKEISELQALTMVALLSDVVDISLGIVAITLVSRVLEMQLRVVDRNP
jgi:hypothetical protein